MQATPRTPPTESAAAAGTAAPAPTSGTQGYWLSSLELLRGVEVQAVGVRAVPTEALRELLRMRGAWRDAGHALIARQPTPASEPVLAVPSEFELDIALDAEGRVTVPGELLPAAG